MLLFSIRLDNGESKKKILIRMWHHEGVQSYDNGVREG